MLRTRAVVALARTTRGGAADHDRTGSERGTRAARWSAMGTYKSPFSSSTPALPAQWCFLRRITSAA
jgi:hypothetical protein